MSVITDVVLFLGSNFHQIGAVDDIKALPCWNGSPPQLIDTDNAGGGKHFCEPMFCGSYNHLNEREVVRQLRKIPWDRPLEWTLVAMHEETIGQNIYRQNDALLSPSVYDSDDAAAAQYLPPLVQ